MSHLKKRADGHLIKNSAGHLVKTCGPSWEVGDDCDCCTGSTPKKFTVVFSGILDCADVGNPHSFNGTYTLTQTIGNSCLWRYEVLNTIVIELECAAGIWSLWIKDVDTAYVFNEADIDPFTCDDGGTATNDNTVSGDCSPGPGGVSGYSGTGVVTPGP